jgi:hypothetical protein
MTEKMRRASLFLVINVTISLCGKVRAWLHGHTLMQILQSVPIFPQYSKQVSSFSFHRSDPLTTV